jgi:hypothetical protein
MLSKASGYSMKELIARSGSDMFFSYLMLSLRLNTKWSFENFASPLSGRRNYHALTLRGLVVAKALRC